MLVHLRLTVPRDETASVCDLLSTHPAVTNLTCVENAVLKPTGDLVELDVARERAGEVVRRLQTIGLDERGGIVLSEPTGTPFRRARELEAATPGHPDDAVIWDSVVEEAESGAVPTLSDHLFLVIAVALGAVAVVTDSAVLVVGAMVVGPEYTSVAALSAGLALARPALIGRALRLVVLQFVFAIVVVTLLALAARAAGWIAMADVTRPRPSTGFIWHPDRWSLVVALLAGVAGALALALSRSATMVGVFISVTTVPAAGNLALALALGAPGELRGSLEQLALNLAAMTVAGALTLLVVRFGWTRLAASSELIFRTRPRTGSGARA